MVRATVREWDDDLGWGVLESGETPGGCWAHYSAIVTPTISRSPGTELAKYKSLDVGEKVELEWEPPGRTDSATGPPSFDLWSEHSAP